MKKHTFLVGVAGLLLIGALFTAGCSSSNEDGNTAGDAAAGNQQTQAAATTETDMALDPEIAALANPKPGFDPVCGMKLTAQHVTAEVDGKTYGFCSEACKSRFEEDPEQYLAAAGDESHDGQDHDGHDH